MLLVSMISYVSLTIVWDSVSCGYLLEILKLSLKHGLPLRKRMLCIAMLAVEILLQALIT
jgi:hypothetical protein